MIYVISDLHFGHNRNFIYKPRGHENIQDHDEDLIRKINETVGANDDLYILGDLMLMDDKHGIECLQRINCKHLHIVIGNHDTSKRVKQYKSLPKVEEVEYNIIFKYKKKRFLCSHYGTLVGGEYNMMDPLWNLSGHTHSPDEFENMQYKIYNVAADAHDGYPISIEDINKRIEYFKNSYM